jgi:hypothetical protein
MELLRNRKAALFAGLQSQNPQKDKKKVGGLIKLVEHLDIARTLA